MEGLTGPQARLLLSTFLLLVTSGCTSVISSRHAQLDENAIPAHRLPPEFAASPKDDMVPIDFSLLRQPFPPEHEIGPGDVLGVYVEEVLAEEGQLADVYFPPQERHTIIESPSVGHPVDVRLDGSVALPYIPPVHVAGLTLHEAAALIREKYVERSILRTNRDRVTVSLVKPRSAKVYVLREDTGPTMTAANVQVLSRRGSAQLLELPIYENNVLRALTETGGLPGTDAHNVVWIIRGDQLDDEARQRMVACIEAGESPETLVEQHQPSTFVRIPLRIYPGQPLPFTPADTILHDGDILFIESRDEFFLTGGLIGGGKFPLPRDRDVDVLEAIAVANTNVYGPAGNSTGTLFRSGPGNIIPPTRAYVIRRLPNGEQIKIYVDMRAALNDPRERVTIMDGDLVLLKYRPAELMGNICLNFVNVAWAIPNN